MPYKKKFYKKKSYKKIIIKNSVIKKITDPLYLRKSTSRRLLALSWLLAMFIEYKRHKGTMSRESYFVFFQSELFTFVYFICLKEITAFVK